MAIITYPLNGIDYDASNAETYLSTRTSGVYSADKYFKATITGDRKITISEGIAWIQNAEFKGKSVVSLTPESVDIAIADGVRPRKDRIVLRFDKAKNKSEIIVLKGTPDTSPTPPDISRTESIYDLGLYIVNIPASSVRVSISDITNTMLDESVCGLMRDGVTGIPTSHLNNQVNSLLADLRKLIADVDKDNFFTKQESLSTFAKVKGDPIYGGRDWNNFTENNVHQVAVGNSWDGTKNGPNQINSNIATYGFLKVESNNKTIVQTYIPSQQTILATTVQRISYEGTRWQPWKKIGYGLTAQDVGALGKTEKAADSAKLDNNTLAQIKAQFTESITPAGITLPFAGKVAPAGWLVCDGKAVSRTTYAKLFSAIGTLYGSGDGSTTFNLPNLGGNTVIGGTSEQVGRKTGSVSETLYAPNMPPHWHPWAAWINGTNTPDGQYTGLAGFKGNGGWETIKGGELSYEGGTGIGVTGGGQPHNNMQPSVYMTYIIKT